MKGVVTRIFHNWPLKLASLLIAIVIWYIAVNNYDPRATRSYSVKVEVTNESYIANGKQVFTIEETYKTVTVYITGNKSKLDKISESSISVIADLTQIVDLERDPVTVPLQVTCEGFDRTDISLSRDTIPISIETVSNKTLNVTVTTGDTSPNKNYEIGSLTPNPSSLTIYGPESVISRIDSVIARIDVSNMSVSSERTADLTFIDTDQNEISEETIADDVTFENNVSEVRVAVELWRKQTGIRFKVEYQGEPASGYQVSGITTTPEEVTVAGNNTAISQLVNNGGVIDISSDLIDISGLSADTTFEIDITDLLPENMKVSSSSSSIVTINIAITPNNSKEFKIDVDQIDPKGLKTNLTISYDVPEITVRVSGSDTVLESLSADDISVTIDVSELSAGDFNVVPSITLPAGCELVNQDLAISVHLKEISVKENSTESATPTPTPAASN